MSKDLIKNVKLFLFKMMFSLYPPYPGAGIRITHMSRDYATFDISMKLRFYSKNYFRTHSGI